MVWILAGLIVGLVLVVLAQYWRVEAMAARWEAEYASLWSYARHLSPSDDLDAPLTAKTHIAEHIVVPAWMKEGD